MSRKLIVKIGTDKNTKITINVNDDESYDDFVNKLCQSYPIEDDKYFKFICKGKLLNAGNFNTLNSGSILLALICNKIPITDPIPLTQSTSTQSTTNQLQNQILHLPDCKCTCDQQLFSSTQSTQLTQSTPSTPSTSSTPSTPSISSISPVIENETTYTYEQVKSTMIVFLDFIRSNPQVKAMYENDFSQLISELINNPTLEKIIREILRCSKQITEAVKTGGKISLRLPGTDDTDDDEEIIVTPEDRIIIEEIITMGFDPNLVVVTYLKNNKNKDATINVLLST